MRIEVSRAPQNPGEEPHMHQVVLVTRHGNFALRYGPNEGQLTAFAESLGDEIISTDRIEIRNELDQR